MTYILRSTFLEHLEKIFSLKDKDYLKWTLIWSSGFVVTLSILLANYYLFVPNNDPAWLTRIEEKCGAEKLEKSFEKYYLVSLGQVIIGFAAYLGLLLSVCAR